MTKPALVYVMYIAATIAEVWNGLNDPALTKRYWGNHHNASDWTVGSPWAHQDADSQRVDVVGEVLESDRPNKLVLSWAFPAEAEDSSKVSRVSFELTQAGEAVRLTVTHEGLQPGSPMEVGVSEGWPVVLSSLKSILETGKPLRTPLLDCD